MSSQDRNASCELGQARSVNAMIESTGSTDRGNSGRIELMLLGFTHSSAIDHIVPSNVAEPAFPERRGLQKRTE